MFSTKTQLAKRTPENGTDRESFLSLLVDEYLNSTSHDAKRQILANLANFAYDPINYEFIRNVGVLDIFLFVVKNECNRTLLHFATAGICNLCADPLNADYIITNCGIKPLTTLLNCGHSEVIADIITTLLYMYNDQTCREIKIPEVLLVVKKLTESNDKILSNLATIFLENVSSA